MRMRLFLGEMIASRHSREVSDPTTSGLPPEGVGQDPVRGRWRGKSGEEHHHTDAAAFCRNAFEHVLPSNVKGRYREGRDPSR